MQSTPVTNVTDVVSVDEVTGPQSREFLVPMTHTDDETEESGTVKKRHSHRAGVVARRALFSTLAVAALLATGLSGFAAPSADAANVAAGYPTWEDVQNAKNNESLKATEIANIQTLISTLQTNVEVTQAASVAAGDAYYAAQQEYLMQEYRATELQAQADAEAAAATDAETKVGQVASQLYRSGGDDTALKLLFSEDSTDADQLLNQLGQMDKLMERNQTVYDDAVLATNSAQSLSDQAKVARDERDRLQKIAEDAWVTAQAAAQAAADALAAQQSNLMTLQAQLLALQDETTNVTTQYEAGVEAERQRLAAEEAARIAAAEEARRRAEEEAAKNPPATTPQPPAAGGGGGGGGSSAGTGGWVRPSYGSRTSGYGPRYSQCGPSYCMSSFHQGVDLASGCGSGIYAAQSGTVTYAGYNGGYGNYVRVDHGGGTSTGYAHIQSGGILVNYGQWVNAGDLIALEGNTGNSFGCHVHFEVYIWGSTINPIDFMAARGIWV